MGVMNYGEDYGIQATQQNGVFMVTLIFIIKVGKDAKDKNDDDDKKQEVDIVL